MSMRGIGPMRIIAEVVRFAVNGKMSSNGQKALDTADAVTINAKAVPAAKSVDRKYAAPGVKPRTKLYNLCRGLRPGKFNDVGKPWDMNSVFNKRLDEYLKDGKIDKDEFEELMGLKSVTDEFWLLFTGGKEAIWREGEQSVEVRFGACLENCKRSIAMTGDTLYTISSAEHIVPVALKQLGKAVKNMGWTKDMLRDKHIADFLFRAKVFGGDGNKKGLENLSDTTWELFAFALFMEYTDYIWKDVGYKDMKELDLSDPSVLERFSVLFGKFIQEGKATTEDELEALIDFQEKVMDSRNIMAGK